MYRIRFHGRGGQGIKTASRMLGTAIFHAGYQVQDAPRYGAERRGAPIFAFVRAAHETINERGIIQKPDLVLVADDSLIGIPSAGVLQGVTDSTVMLITGTTPAETWQSRLNTHASVISLPLPATTRATPEKLRGAQCVGAAAGLLGIVDKTSLEAGVREELAGFSQGTIDENVAVALAAFDAVGNANVTVTEGAPMDVAHHQETDWIDLDLELQALSAPAIHNQLTSVEVRTGLWRTLRPVINYDICNKCNWVCSNFCPDSAIKVNNNGYPEIDLDHCKGCMICVAQCPPHAIEAIPERQGTIEEAVQ